MPTLVSRSALSLLGIESDGTFFASLLYSSVKLSRSPISSVSDRLPRSPLVDVHVALLWMPLEVLWVGRDKRARDEAAEGRGCRSGVMVSREALMFTLCETGGAQQQIL